MTAPAIPHDAIAFVWLEPLERGVALLDRGAGRAGRYRVGMLQPDGVLLVELQTSCLVRAVRRFSAEVDLHVAELRRAS